MLVCVSVEGAEIWMAGASEKKCFEDGTADGRRQRQGGAVATRDAWVVMNRIKLTSLLLQNQFFTDSSVNKKTISLIIPNELLLLTFLVESFQVLSTCKCVINYSFI